MRCSSTAGFRKLKTCPSAETLLLYNNAGLSIKRRQKVAVHLVACDFCEAERRLLSRHWTRAVCGDSAAPVKTIEMPLNLRRLAEDLMDEPSRHGVRFADTIYEINRLTLTDA